LTRLAPDTDRAGSRSDTVGLPPEPANSDLTSGYGARPEPAATFPRMFGCHELLGEIARGGMGVVYRAREAGLGRVVALKMILSPRFASPEAVRRFRAEAEAAAKLDHPGIVPIFQVGEVEGQPYFSMGLVEAGSLDERLQSGPLPPHEAAALVKAVASAVHYAHSRNIVHRDLKPANILLHSDGRPMITDFGLAKEVGAESGLTSAGQVMGTPNYMAPEQAEGKASEVGPLADVWAMGAILYALLTGKPPFETASAIETLSRVVCHDPTPPRRLRPEVGPDLDTICLKCLEKSPAARYASAAEVADELGRYLDGVPILARPIGRLEGCLRWARRSPALAASVVLGLVALLSLVGLVVSASYKHQLQAKNASLEAANTRLEEAAGKLAEANAGLAAARKDLDRLFTQRRVASALSEWRNAEMERARRLLDDCPEEHRHWEWHHVHSLCNAGLTLTGHEGPVISAAFSRDGKSAFGCARLAAQNQLELRSWDVATGKSLRALTLPGGSSCAFSPDGSLLAAAELVLPYHIGPNRVRIFDTATGKQTRTLDGHNGLVSHVTFSPDGRLVAASAMTAAPGKLKPATLKIWDTATGATHHTMPAPLLRAVAFSRDSKRVALATGKGVVIRDIADAREVASFPTYTGVTGLAFSPDGRQIALLLLSQIRTFQIEPRLEGRVIEAPARLSRIAYSPDGKHLLGAGEGRVVHVWSASLGHLLHTFRGHSGVIDTLAFSPDGRRVASGGFDRTVRVWDVYGQEPPILAADTMYDPTVARPPLPEITNAVFSPDGRWIATACGKQARAVGLVRILDASTGRPAQSFAAHVGPVCSLAFSPDGKRLATAGVDGLVHLWDTTTWGKPRSRKCVNPVLAVSFAPDGRRVASLSSDPKQALELQVWDIETGREVFAVREGVGFAPRQPHLGVGPASQLAFGPDGAWIITGAGESDPHPVMRGVHRPGPLKVWDAATGRLIRTIGSGPLEMLRAVAVTPDGKRVATARYDHIAQKADLQVWSVGTGERVMPLRGVIVGVNAMPEGLAFSPDGQRVALATGFSVVLFDSGTGEEILTLLPLRLDRLQSVAFSPDGRRIAAASFGGPVMTWDSGPR
jgi:WD40 repeat protein